MFTASVNPIIAIKHKPMAGKVWPRFLWCGFKWASFITLSGGEDQ